MTNLGNPATALLNNKPLDISLATSVRYSKDPIQALSTNIISDLNSDSATLQIENSDKLYKNSVLVVVYDQDNINFAKRMVLALARIVLSNKV